MAEQLPTWEETKACGMGASGILITNTPKILECASKISTSGGQ
jgi:hypothetical protein